MFNQLFRIYGIFSITIFIFICLHTQIPDNNGGNENFGYVRKSDVVERSISEPVSNKSNLVSDKKVNNVTSINHQNSSTELKNKKSVSESPIYILWTRWRSGSSFLGQLLAYAQKNTFYSYEPLHAFGLKVMRDDDKKTKAALKFLFSSMNCRYDRYDYLVNYFIETEFYYFYNPLTKKTCQPIVNCNSSTILNEYCKGASSQVIKLLRLSLEYGEHVLKKNPQVKIIYLARDPRALLQSRSRIPWCLLEDCNDPKTVCDLLQTDVDFALKLQGIYPDRFIFVRYEDLALDTEGIFKSIWKKLGQKYTNRITRLIQAHISKDKKTKGIYGLQKESKKRAFSWRSSLSYKNMNSIQNSCSSVMNNLGYGKYSSDQEYSDVTQLPIDKSWNSPLNMFKIFK